MNSINVPFCVIYFYFNWMVVAQQIPTIIEHPTDTIIAKHDPATLKCHVNGNPMPTIQWYKDGIALQKLSIQHRILILPSGDLFFLKATNGRKENDTGVYYCEAKNEFGLVKSKNATLQVAVLREEFRVEPTSLRITNGETAIFECVPPKGVPEPIVWWRKINGEKLNTDASKKYHLVDGYNLAIQDVQESDDGRYQCIAKNIVGIRESEMAFLRISVKPFIIHGPLNQSVVRGSSVIFQCQVGGNPMPDVLWRRTSNGGNMPIDRVHILQDRSLRLDNVIELDEGEYSCDVDNAVGSISAIGSLVVLSPPSFKIHPTHHQMVDESMNATFECHAIGKPNPLIFWSINGNRSLIFTGHTLDNYHATITDDGLSLLKVINTNVKNKNAIIICNAVNAVGSISERAKLLIRLNSDSDHPPQLLYPPPIITDGPVNQTLTINSNAQINCKIPEWEMATISWYHDGILILPISNRINITNSSGTLTITHLNPDIDEGIYTCVVTNRNGKTTASGFLKIKSKLDSNVMTINRTDNLKKLPISPTKPQIVNVRNDKITLAWQLNSNNNNNNQLLKDNNEDDDKQIIIGYVIDWFSNENNDNNNKKQEWKSINLNATETVYTINNLKYGITYWFIVRSKNGYGLSSPSPISDGITTTGDHHKLLNNINNWEHRKLEEAQQNLLTKTLVDLLETIPIDSTSVRLIWEIKSGQFVEGFYIYSIKLSSTGDDDNADANNNRALLEMSNRNINNYKIVTVLHGGGASMCTINDLDKYTNYEFFLIPFYKTVVGHPTNSRNVRTLENIPSQSPLNVEATLINSTAIYLTWKSPPITTLNGKLKNYQIIVKGYDYYNVSKLMANISVDGLTPQLLLTNLSSDTMYTISIAAATNIGFGPFTSPAILRLDTGSSSSSASPKNSFKNGYERYPINHLLNDNLLTQTWFVILLGAIIIFIIFLFIGFILFKRNQFIKQSSHLDLTIDNGNHSIGTIRKFPTLPINENGIWIDPNGGIWRQTSIPVMNRGERKCTLNNSDYAQITSKITNEKRSSSYYNDDYRNNRRNQLNTSEYAEVLPHPSYGVESTFKNNKMSSSTSSASSSSYSIHYPNERKNYNNSAYATIDLIDQSNNNKYKNYQPNNDIDKYSINISSPLQYPSLSLVNYHYHLTNNNNDDLLKSYQLNPKPNYFSLQPNHHNHHQRHPNQREITFKTNVPKLLSPNIIENKLNNLNRVKNREPINGSSPSYQSSSSLKSISFKSPPSTSSTSSSSSSSVSLSSEYDNNKNTNYSVINISPSTNYSDFV